MFSYTAWHVRMTIPTTGEQIVLIRDEGLRTSARLEAKGDGHHFPEAVRLHAWEVHHRRHLYRLPGDGEISEEARPLLHDIPGPGKGLRHVTTGRSLEIPSREGCPAMYDHGHKGHIRRLESVDTNSTRDAKNGGYRSGRTSRVGSESVPLRADAWVNHLEGGIPGPYSTRTISL